MPSCAIFINTNRNTPPMNYTSTSAILQTSATSFLKLRPSKECLKAAPDLGIDPAQRVRRFVIDFLAIRDLTIILPISKC
jgi:hypothetical protein